MDIRYHAGGYDAQTVIPGEAITMLMEFQAIDAKPVFADVESEYWCLCRSWYSLNRSFRPR